MPGHTPERMPERSAAQILLPAAAAPLPAVAASGLSSHLVSLYCVRVCACTRTCMRIHMCVRAYIFMPVCAQTSVQHFELQHPEPRFWHQCTYRCQRASVYIRMASVYIRMPKSLCVHTDGISVHTDAKEPLCTYGWPLCTYGCQRASVYIRMASVYTQMPKGPPKATAPAWKLNFYPGAILRRCPV